MDQQSDTNVPIPIHPLIEPILGSTKNFMTYAYSEEQSAWDDDQKRSFYEQSLNQYTTANTDYINETERFIYILEEAEKIAKSYLDATSGMGTSKMGTRFISINEVRAAASNTLNRWLGRGW